jgi:hypothetical protein
MKIEKELVMTSINSILCDYVTIPAAGSRITYTYISGENADGEFEWSQVSSFLGNGSEEDVIRCVNSLRSQANDDHHVFIEAFDLEEDGSYSVFLGS